MELYTQDSYLALIVPIVYCNKKPFVHLWDVYWSVIRVPAQGRSGKETISPPLSSWCVTVHQRPTHRAPPFQQEGGEKGPRGKSRERAKNGALVLLED